MLALTASIVAETDDGMRFREEAKRYAVAVDQMLRLIQAGKMAEAIDYDETTVDPMFGDLARQAATLRAELDARADQTEWLTLLSIVAILLGGALLIGRLSRRAERANQRTFEALHDALTGLPNRALITQRSIAPSRTRRPDRAASRSCSSISTTSRRSTTASATPPATNS